MSHDHGHAPTEELAPPLIVIDNDGQPTITPDPEFKARKWSPLRDYAIRLTDLYVQINLAFLAKEVLPDHDMLESLVRVTLQSKYSEWITDPRPPIPEQEDDDGRTPRGNRRGAKAAPATGGVRSIK